jgi:hypothetical protein
MVKNHSRKTKKKGGRKYHIGGRYDTEVIPEGIVKDTRPIFGEDSESNPNKLKEEVVHDDIPPPENNVVASTKPNERQFQFTRHVLSCNNLKEGKYYTAGKDFEPGATVYGIFETIKYAQLADQAPNFDFGHVYVSNLYRTWITAVLLYGTNVDKDRLNLYISPFLKEYHGFFKRGNFPKDIKHMANKFLKFLTELHSYCIESEGDVYELYSERDRTTWYESLPREIVLHLPPGQNNKSNQIIYKKLESEKLESEPYKLVSFCEVEDTAGPNSGADFTQTGDLQKFMEWYSNERSNYFGSHDDENNKIHIVTHSHIMRDYLSKFKIDISEEGKAPIPISFDIDAIDNASLKEIRKSNSWHFITTQNKLSKQGTYANIEKAVDDFKLVKGVPIKKEEAKNLEDKNKDQSLCGTEGSVIPVAKQTCDRGGRRMRKRNIRRTKKHSKRRNNKSRKHHK